MKALLPLLGLLLLAMGRPDAALAAPDNEPTPAFIEERVEDILSKPPFGTTRETYTYRYRWDEEEEVEDEGEPLDLDFSWLEWLGDLFGWLNGAAGGVVWSFEVILWVFIIALVVLVLLSYKRWLPYLRREQMPPPPTLPSAMFGKDALVEPLPDDIVAKAWECWQQGDARGCLSLLYRGALLRIILSRRIQLPDSATEEDCLREVIPLESPERAGYFQSLTRLWQATAYAARAPAEAPAEELVQGWREHFGEST